MNNREFHKYCIKRLPDGYINVFTQVSTQYSPEAIEPEEEYTIIFFFAGKKYEGISEDPHEALNEALNNFQLSEPRSITF